MDKTDLTAALYARVSTERQAQANTIASQIEAIQHRATQDGLTIDESMCFVDDGYRGATLARPALEQLRDVAATGAIDRLYVLCPDRLARKYAYQVLLVDELCRCGVELVFLNQELGKTPEQDLLLQVQGVVAEYERAKIMERSRRGKRHAARHGSVSVLSGAPFGYRYIPVRDGGGQADYQIVLEEARVVREIFNWVAQERVSMGEVCRRLEGRGIPTRKGNTTWDRMTLWNMLRNPAYKGCAAFGKRKAGPWSPKLLRPMRGCSDQPKRGTTLSNAPPDQWIHIPVPALVDEELFDLVQVQLVENGKRCRQRKRGVTHLLQGLMVCGTCGYAICGTTTRNITVKGERRTHTYYRCVSTVNRSACEDRKCDNRSIDGAMIEEAVWKDASSLLSNPHRLEQEYERRLTVSGKPSDWRSTDHLQKQIKHVKRGIARLVDAYEDGLIEKQEFESRVQRARERLRLLEAQAEQQADEETQRNDLRLVIGHLQEFTDRVHRGLESLDWHTRREVIKSLIKRIEVTNDGVRIIYRVDPAPLPDDGARILPNRSRRPSAHLHAGKPPGE